MYVCNCEGDREATSFNRWCDNCRAFWIDAYRDGYQQGIEPGWPDPEHVGTEPFEYGWIDARALVLGNEAGSELMTERVERRLLQFQSILQDRFIQS